MLRSGGPVKMQNLALASHVGEFSEIFFLLRTQQNLIRLPPCASLSPRNRTCTEPGVRRNFQRGDASCQTS